MDDNVEVSISKTRSLIGKIVSAKRDKTVSVLIQRRVKHEKYGKYVKRSKKYHAHDETNACHEGDDVEIRECRPISRTKNWVVSRVIHSTSIDS